MTERKVRWNMETDTGEQTRGRYRYTVVILNEPREIDRIKQRFIEQMNPFEVRDISDYLIPKSNGLHCVIFSFSSEKGKIEYSDKIYKNPAQFRRDRNLTDTDEGRLLSHIEKLVA